MVTTTVSIWWYEWWGLKWHSYANWHASATWKHCPGFRTLNCFFANVFISNRRLLPVTTQSLFDTQTDTTIFPSVSNFQDETTCPTSDENEVPPEFDESLIDMSEHDIQQFIDGQQNKNTMEKTLRDVGLVEAIFRLKKEERNIHWFLEMN